MNMNLTRQETAVLRLLCEGLSNQEIADKLFVSIRTVHWHTQSIYHKFNVHRRVQAVNVARERGLI